MTASAAIGSTLLALALANAGAGAVAAAEDRRPAASGVDELVLDNGMRFLLLERKGLPLVAAGWATRSGSAVESPDATGIAHLLEHLMFRGSEVIGTTDWARERALIEEREELEDARRREIAGGGAADPGLERRIARVDERLRGLRRKGEYALLYTEAGALGINAVTNQDLTSYVVQVPPSRLELWFWLESDRLLRPVFRELYDEPGVIEEERAQRILSVPGGAERARFAARFWGEGHPYSWPAIGRPEHVAAVRRADVEAHFRRHYRPDRLTAVLIGDFDRERTARWAERYFGRLPAGDPGASAGESPAPDPSPPDPGALRFEPFELREACECRPQVELRFHTVPFGHPDGAVLDVIAGLLNGRTGRLHRGVVLDDELAFSAAARHEPQRLGGAFALVAEARAPDAGGAVLDALQRSLERELERLRREPPSERELDKVENQIVTDAARQLKKPAGLAQRLLIYAALGDWRHLEEWPRATREVTAADVARVLDAWLVPERRAVLRLERAAAGTGSGAGR